MVWLFFIAVSTLNLLAGIATAMYLRRQIELLHAAQAAEAAKEAKAPHGGPRRAKTGRRTAGPPAARPQVPPNPTATADDGEELSADLAELRNSLGLPDAAASHASNAESTPTAAGESASAVEPAADNWAAITADIANSAVPWGFLQQPHDEESSANGQETWQSKPSAAPETTADEARASPTEQEAKTVVATCEDLDFLADALERNTVWVATLVDLDTDLRRAEMTGEPEVTDQWDRILRLGQDYLAELSALREQFRREDGPPADVALVREDIRADWDATAADMQAAARELSLLDVRGEPTAARRQLRRVLNRLLSASYRLRDHLEAAYAARAVCEDLAPAAIPGRSTDERTEYLTPLGLQMYLAPWWQAAGRQRRPLLAAVLDADRLRDWNDRLGHPAVNEIAASLARFIREIPRREAVFARLGTAKFLLLSNEADARSWTELVERIRQSVETATFEYEGQGVQLTIAAAVTQLRDDDTSQTFFERLRETLAEAKRAGGNRTYSDYGRGPTPVVPANIQVREQTVHVESPDAEPVAAGS
ncbi:MAG: diguanylate cyclase [Thermogutta sp.]|nr:diguanylate cyclase [Thermogutta sp.]